MSMHSNQVGVGPVVLLALAFVLAMALIAFIATEPLSTIENNLTNKEICHE